jgi:hypothetical protein
MLRKTTICIVTGVTEATMSNIVRGGGCGESTGRRVLERINLPHTIALKKFTPRKKGPSQKNQKVKINGEIIISSELANRDKIFNNARCNKNIAKMKRTVR